MAYIRLMIGIGFWVLCAGAFAQSPGLALVAERLAEVRERAATAIVGDEGRDELLEALDGLLATLALHGSARDVDVLVDVASFRRAVALAGSAGAGERAAWLEVLADPAGPGRSLVFLTDGGDRASGVLGTFSALREAYGLEALAKFATLTAALCVVHDGPVPYTVSVNENLARSAGAVALFGYYTRHERSMLFGLRDVPAELLVFVVDATASVSELEWALGEHRGDRAVGQRFFDIEYDHEHARTGRPKAVTEQGFTIQNIARFGGVCADQCHFATTVGKAIGVPTAYVTARGGQAGHAWVGYLHAQGRRARWNFDSGRYEEFQGLRGDIRDPRTGATISDDELGLLARLTSVDRGARFACAAWLDAAMALRDGATPLEVEGAKGSPRVGVGGVLELLEMALRLNPADRRGWAMVRSAMDDGSVPNRERVRWSEVVIRLCEDSGAEHFMVGVLEPMIASLDDGKARISAWERVLEHVRTKKDLRARIRMMQAAEALARGDQRGAYLAYQDVIDNTLNGTRESRYAVAGAVGMLERAGKHKEAAELLSGVLSRVEKPSYAAVFTVDSNHDFVLALARAYASKHRVAIAGL